MKMCIRDRSYAAFRRDDRSSVFHFNSRAPDIHALFAVLAAICDHMGNIRLFYNQRARTLSDDNREFLSRRFLFNRFFHSRKVEGRCV